MRHKIIISITLFFLVVISGVLLWQNWATVEQIFHLEKTEAPAQNKIGTIVKPKDNGPGFAILWMTDFTNNRVIGFTPQGKVVWAQNMSAPPIPRESWYFIGGVERVTVAPNGNLITSYGDAMIVQEINRQSHNLDWQYGTAGLQSYRGGKLDEPHKAWKINDHEVVINDSNDREVIVVDENTNQIVWQYGQYHALGTGPGILDGNTSVLPINGGKQFLITETLASRIILVDRATKNILWQYSKPDAKWLENVTATKDGGFILSDRLKGEVFAVSHEGAILWDLAKLSDENTISYPTDTAELENGNVLIAEAGRARIVEVVPATGQIVREYLIHGFVSTIAIDQNNLDMSPRVIGSGGQPAPNKTEVVAVDDAAAGMTPGAVGTAENGQTFSGTVADVNASTGRAGQIAMKNGSGLYAVEVYNYTRLVNKSGAPMSLENIQQKDSITVTGTISNNFISSQRVQDNSR